MTEETLLLSLRQGLTGQVLQLEARYQSQLGQHVVLWDGILEAFPDATNVQHGTVVITRARDSAWQL